MADLIIKGMEMPRGCDYCPLVNRDTLGMCMVTKRLWDSDPGQPLRPDWCPLRPAPEWISVEDKDNSPEPFTDVLLCFERDAWPDGADEPVRKRDIGVGYCSPSAEFWHVDGCSGVTGIAWMPLPEPPKEEGNTIGE